MQVIRTVRLAAADVETTALGFGCANLYRLPSRRDRVQMLNDAFDAGIRHFDAAPMYGLGKSEPELGELAHGHRAELVVVTKFGIRLTRIARVLGRVQSPIRSLLATAPSLQRKTRDNAATPASGRVGALLYDAPEFTAAVAKSSLERSLRDLRTDYLDVLLLHDPAPGTVRSDDVCAFLDAAKSAGRIRAWGIAGEPSPSIEVAAAFPQRVRLLQVRDDILYRSSTDAITVARGGISFGFLNRALPALLTNIGSIPDRRRRWLEQVGTDFADSDATASFLLQEAMAAHESGVVLFSSIRRTRLEQALRDAQDVTDAQAARFAAFRNLIADELQPAMGLLR